MPVLYIVLSLTLRRIKIMTTIKLNMNSLSINCQDNGVIIWFSRSSQIIKNSSTYINCRRIYKRARTWAGSRKVKFRWRRKGKLALYWTEFDKTKHAKYAKQEECTYVKQRWVDLSMLIHTGEQYKHILKSDL